MSKLVATYGTGQLVKGFHGDPSRGNAFWEYPNHRSLVTRRWDTHDASTFCSNHTRCGSGGGVREYICNGHSTTTTVLSEEELQSKLSQLQAMGFTNRTLGAEYLRASRGNLDEVIESFLSAQSTTTSSPAL